MIASASIRSFKILSVMLCLIMLFPSVLGVFTLADTKNASASTLHVKAGGEGDGSSADSPLSDIGEAFSLLADEGGRIVVHGKYELASSSLHDDTWGAFVEPEHSGKITVSGSDAFLVCKENYRYYMSGATTFESIGFSGSGAFTVAARYNPLCMGDGISIIGFSDGVYLIGGFYGSNSGLTDEALTKDSYIEIRSGSYKQVAGYNRATADKACTGEASIVIKGGSVNCVSAGASNLNSAFSGNEMASLRISMSGGDVYKICDVDMTSYGSVGAISLDYTGGDIENVIISAAKQKYVSFSSEMSGKIAKFIRFFDRYKQDDNEEEETRKIKVACVGDSITLGLGTEDSVRDSYPAKLAQMLGEAYEVGNFGEGGKTMLTSGGSSYVECDAYANSLAFAPDVVLIMLGSNDLSTLLSDEKAKDAIYDDTLALIQKYSAIDPAPVIYLLSPTQRTDDKSLDLAIRDVLRPVYEKAAADAKVGYIDIYSVSQNMKQHFPDSIHPDATAASYIATWLYGAVVSNSSITEIKSDAVPVEIIIKTEADTQAPPPVDSTVAEKEEGESISGPLAVALFVVSFVLVSGVLVLLWARAQGKIVFVKANEEKEE